MKLKFKNSFHLILILILTNTYGQHSVNTESSDPNLSISELNNKIVEYLINIDAKSIYALASTNFKAKVKPEELQTTINFISDLLKRNNVKYLDTIPKTSSKSSSYVNGLLKETIQTDYLLRPEYINDDLKKLFFNSPHYNIQVKISKQNEKWELSDLHVEDKYADMSYPMSEQIENFFNKNDTLLFKYSTLKNNTITKRETRIASNKTLNKFKNLKHINISEVKIKRLSKKSSKIYSLSFQSENLNSSFSNLFNKRKSDNIINTFEFLFFDSYPKIIFVSNNNTFAFFKSKKNKELLNLYLEETTLPEK